MLSSDIKARHAFLENKLQDLQKRIEELRAKAHIEFAEEDIEEAAARVADTELDEAMLDEDLKLLQNIKSALKRIDEGTYGLCRVCGQPIPARRLEVLPWAELCIKDQQESEKLQYNQVALN
ncbi:TraR/DksA family transcriptional regulator [Dictyobacter formicarum]|uniref:Zinc finger DksA/TraR C4-type domain-containing protein n=1 Tax=Dictyobacter formicarum TaxID=2778368 RepID=A0ABQ3VFL5_9CHLR|nr:TraR/DksA C4-type zinc finger protein [Dictyobacter formicarum]GHO84443.1 hypothetical protein KSZ_24490 [Dictyobacter formicarum]